MESKWARKKWNRKPTAYIGTSPATTVLEALVDGKRTWESLGTEKPQTGKETYHKRVAGLPSRGDEKNHLDRVGSGRADDGQVHPQYEDDGYPDKHKALRIGPTLESEKNHCKHYCNFGTTSRSILPDLRLAIGIIRGEKIRDSGTVWETGKSIAN